MKRDLKYPNPISKEFYFISKVAGPNTLLASLPLLGRIPKNDFSTMIEGALKAYEREYKTMDIHLIDEILELVAYIERTLS